MRAHTRFLNRSKIPTIPARVFDLTFISHACPSPIIHKMILDHIKQVNVQINEIRTLTYTAPFSDKEKYVLNLPITAKADIQEERDEDDKKTYLYHDIRFELNQDEIFSILMGQELYGEPGLCLRELIQNSLDALQLRDLHCSIPREKRFKPVDILSAGEKLQINVDWREENGESWISVSDNGTGMTKFSMMSRIFIGLKKLCEIKANECRYKVLKNRQIINRNYLRNHFFNKKPVCEIVPVISGVSPFL